MTDTVFPTLDGVSDAPFTGEEQNNMDSIPIDAPIEPVVTTDTISIDEIMASSPSPLKVEPEYTPSSENAIIGTIPPANFDNMLKVLSVLVKDKSNDSIMIRASQIKQQTSIYMIVADLTSILNYQGKPIDLDIVNPKKYINLFDQFRGQENIFILNDADNSRYIITNGEIELFLAKQESLVTNSIEGIDFTGSQQVCVRFVDKESRKIIKNLSKDEEHIEYLIQDNSIKAIHVPNTAKYVFQDFKNDPKTKQLNETNSDLTLRTAGFLPIEADQYTITIHKLNDGEYASVTDCKIGGQIDVRIIEKCNVTTGGNLFI